MVEAGQSGDSHSGCGSEGQMGGTIGDRSGDSHSGCGSEGQRNELLANEVSITFVTINTAVVLNVTPYCLAGANLPNSTFLGLENTEISCQLEASGRPQLQ